MKMGINLPTWQNEMAVFAARFLHAIAFELANGRNWRLFFRRAEGIKSFLLHLGFERDARSVDGRMSINSSETEWSPVRESDSLALLCGFSGPTGSGYTSLRNITLRFGPLP